MSNPDYELPSVDTGSNPLSEQAVEIIEEDTTWVELGGKLDVERLKYRQSFSDTHKSKDFEAVFLAYLWATVEDESYSGIPKRLDKRPELARAFGFDPDDLPSESTFRPARLTDRFEELESTVERAADEIRSLAVERGAPIGYDIISQSGTGEEDGTPSKRTINRLLRKKGNEVLEELKNVAIPSISLPRPENPIYDDQQLLVSEAIGAIKHEAANEAGTSLGDMKNPDPDLDDPFYEDGPSGETVLEAVKEMSVDEIADVVNYGLKKTYTRAKPRLQELENDDGSRFGTRAKVALDITYVAYYGETEGMEWLQGAPEDKSYRWCHKFATAVIVGENTHYVVGVCPLGSTEHAATNAYPGDDKSYYVGDVARRLLNIANKYVDIRMVYADREFHAADVVHTLEKRDLKYVIPAVKNAHIKPLCKRFNSLKRGYDEENDTPLYVKQNVPMHGRVKYETTNTKVRSNVVILPPDEDDPTRNNDSPQPFISNLDVDDETALDRRWACKQIEQYSDRGAIERSYSSIKECASWTTSKEFEVRWFHFAFGCLVYNMWLLVDFLTQERIGVIATRKKPRITLSRFLDWLKRELVVLL